MATSARLVRRDGTVVEQIDIRLTVRGDAMRDGRRWDAQRCPLAKALSRYFGGAHTIADWDTTTIWPKSKCALVTCPTPARLREWMEKYDCAEGGKDGPRELDARFTAKLIYAAGDRRKVEEWCSRWEREEAA